MKYLFFLHPSFLPDDPGQRNSALEWIKAFEDELKLLRVEVKTFHTLTSKIIDFNWIIIFSNDEPETWQTLVKTGSKLVVIPSLAAQPQSIGRSTKAMKLLILLTRALTQRRWPPIDQDLFYRSAPCYFLCISHEWISHLVDDRKVRPEKVQIMPNNPILAAELCFKILK